MDGNAGRRRLLRRPGHACSLAGSALWGRIPRTSCGSLLRSRCSNTRHTADDHCLFGAGGHRGRERVKHGMRQEGILYAARTLFARVDQAIGTAFAGWCRRSSHSLPKLRLARFPKPSLCRLRRRLVSTTIPGLIAAIFYGMLRVTKATYASLARAIPELPSGRTGTAATELAFDGSSQVTRTERRNSWSERRKKKVAPRWRQ